SPAALKFRVALLMLPCTWIDFTPPAKAADQPETRPDETLPAAPEMLHVPPDTAPALNDGSAPTCRLGENVPATEIFAEGAMMFSPAPPLLSHCTAERLLIAVA